MKVYNEFTFENKIFNKHRYLFIKKWKTVKQY